MGKTEVSEEEMGFAVPSRGARLRAKVLLASLLGEGSLPFGSYPFGEGWFPFWAPFVSKDATLFSCAWRRLSKDRENAALGPFA